jgi:hypothetical protein
MNGYLQRLVQTVASPAESVHPWTASVFAGGHQGDFQDVQSGELALPAAALQSRENSAQSFQKSVPAQTLPGAEHNSLISQLRTTHIAPGSTPPEESAHREPSFSKRLIAEPLIANRDIAKPTELGMEPATRAERVIPPRSHGPLIGAQAVIKSGNAVGLSVGSSLVPADKKDESAVRDSVAADRQRDEIQIHIGRIEVTAVHPSPPRAPKARGKEISLDEYLKRRDGRAR